MADRKRITRRAGLALIGAGVATAIPYTHGMTSTVANRETNVETTTDPDALLGIQGAEDASDDEITIVNNADSTMVITVSTPVFRIENVGGDHSANVTLDPGDSQLVRFAPENGTQDDVAFDATIYDDSGNPSGTIQLQRTITIPVAPEPGTTYRIRNVHSGLYLTADAPSGGPWWNPDPGDVYQDVWQGSDAQRWTVEAFGQSTTLEHVSSSALLAIGSAQAGNSFEEVVTSGSLWTGTDERWNLVENADGSYRIESVSNSPDVVDVEAGSTAPGANVIAYQWKGDNSAIANQKWTFDPI